MKNNSKIYRSPLTPVCQKFPQADSTASALEEFSCSPQALVAFSSRFPERTEPQQERNVIYWKNISLSTLEVRQISPALV
jgi:hypothetical protein